MTDKYDDLYVKVSDIREIFDDGSWKKDDEIHDYAVALIEWACAKRALTLEEQNKRNIRVKMKDKKCCGNCLWYDGDITEEYTAFCDEKEINTRASNYCVKFKNKYEVGNNNGDN